MPLAIPIAMVQEQISQPAAQWLSAAFFIGTAATAIPISALLKRLGMIRSTLGILFLTSILQISSYFASPLELLFTLRGFVGAVTSGLLSSRNMITSTYPPL